METTIDLFGDSPIADNAEIRWLLVTNQRNLFYMLAAGLIMSPKGFGDKYYQDTLCRFPGWIPLFANSVPEVCIKDSVSECSHLIPCLASVNLSSLHGPVKAIDRNGLVSDVSFPEEIDGRIRVLLVPAPLPITWVQSIIFESGYARKSCVTDARDFGNVPLLAFRRELAAKLFSSTTRMVWPESVEFDNLDRAMNKPQVVGGMMAMLFHLANHGDDATRACHLVFDPEDGDIQKISDPMISALKDWLIVGPVPTVSDVSQKLYWEAIDKLVDWQSSNTSRNAQDVLLTHLEQSADQLVDRMKQALMKLAKDLQNLSGFVDSTITELFERHPKQFSRVMTIFFLRERCTDLLEFSHPLLKEADYLLAAILFSAREGWLNLPLELRDYPGLSEAVPHRMAAMAHRMSNSGLDLGTPPQRPSPLREQFAPGMRGWNKTQRCAALSLARDCKWTCIQTRITLGKGIYRLEVDGRGMHILIDGEAKTVLTEVDIEQFFVNLAYARLTKKQAKMIYELLKA